MFLLRMRYVKYCMDVWCSLFSIREEMDSLGSSRLVRDLIVEVWMVPLNHVVTISRGWTCKPNVHNMANTKLYFCDLMWWSHLVIYHGKQ